MSSTALVRLVTWTLAFIHTFPARKHLAAFLVAPSLDEGWKGLGALAAIALYLLPVRVQTRVAGHRGIITVDDSGVGIEPADRDRVFDRFFRASDESKLAMPSTGLGLPIVKALVESAGGQVTIDDSPLGGTRFTVELPLTTKHDAAAPDVPVVTEASTFR